MTTDELYARHVIPSYGRFPLTLARGAGTRVWDEDGRAYLDFTSGIAVNSLGHAHPAMQKALAAQSATLIHTSNLYLTRPQAELAARLDGLVGTHGKIFFSNSGAGANEGLYKCPQTRRAEWTPRNHHARRLVPRTHPRGHRRHRAGQGQTRLRAARCRLPQRARHPRKRAGRRQRPHRRDPRRAHPGRGRRRPLDAGFLRGLRALCDAHGMLLLYDEVQCGLGRTGDWCGWHATGAPEAVPDGISWAKGIGGGFPLGAFWVRDRAAAGGGSLADLLGPGTHATTYGGSPLACTVALAVLDTIEKESLLANTRERSAQLREAVTALASPVVRGIRGAGLLLGIEIADFRWRGQTEPDGKTPALRLTLKLLERGLLVVPAGETVIRLLPPLNVRAAECDEAVTILRDTLALAEPLS